MIRKYLVIFLLFLNPLLYLPFGISPFETWKIFAAEICIQVLTVIFIFHFNKSYLAKEGRIFLISLGLIFLLSLLHILFFQYSPALIGNVFRLQGMILLWHLWLLAFISSAIRLEKVPPYVPWITLLGLLIGTWYFGTNQDERMVSTLGEPNALAAELLFIYPFILFSQVSKWVKYLAVFIAVILMALSQSVSGYVGFTVQIIFYIGVMYLNLPIKKVVVACLILILTSFYLPFFENTGPNENRSEIWQTAFYSGMKSPLIGQGFGNIENTLHSSSKELSNFVQTRYVDSSHNIFFDWWLQGGIVGLTLLLFLIGDAVIRFINTKNHLYTMLLLGLITVLSFNPMNVVVLVSFWWLIGQRYRL